METGEVGMTRDTTTIIGEINKLGHEGTTEKLKEVTDKKPGINGNNKRGDGDAEIKRGGKIT